ncbi:MAG: putative D,D-dipeptide transport system permease protein DdpB [Actinobacteria bacterium ADurb.Bin444]|nr:MAG: putative D,D-dipeptide transport system permease protein DdpB [Actinobacteria bacterium ADurb.Bin444]
MIKYIIRRLLAIVLIMFGVTIIMFLVTHLVPADPTVRYLGEKAASNPTIVAAFRARWGLDQPLHTQYFVYMKNLLQGDMGVSLTTRQNVARDLMVYFPATIELAGAAILISAIVGGLTGITAAWWRGKWFDNVARAGSLLGVSVPGFWLGLIVLYIFYFRLGWFPGPGQLSANLDVPARVTGFMTIDCLVAKRWDLFLNALWHLVLPASVLASFSAGLIARTSRSSLLEVMQQDYIRTAKAKGLATSTLLYKHVLRNGLIPTVTLLGLAFGSMLGGTVFVETIFAWPGLGRYAYLASTGLDFPAITGVTLLFTFTYAIVNLLVDLTYAALDPRVVYK